MTPAQLVINQVSETPQRAAQYFAQPQNDESEYSPDDWMCYMCTPEEADFAQADPMLPEIGQALLALNQQGKGANTVEAKQGEKALAKQARANSREDVGIVMKKGTQQQSAKSPGSQKGMARVRRRAARRGTAKEEGNRTSSASVTK